MKYAVSLLASAAAVAAVLFFPAAARAMCNGAPDQKCDPTTEDCACADCQNACSGQCTASNPACTFEDSCVCKDCWTDPACTNPDRKNCETNGMCDFFTEGCCCEDCASLEQCAAFNGDCSGSGGAGGSTGGGGAGGGGAGGSTGGTSDGGSGGLTTPNSDCGCSLPGGPAEDGFSLCVAALGAGMVFRRRRRAERG